MATYGELVVRGTFDGSNLTRGLDASTSRLDAFGSKVASVGATLSVALTAPLLLLGRSVLNATAEMDSLTRGLTAISGDAGDTQRQLVRLADVAKLPGLGFKEAIAGSIRLQAIGLSAGSAERYLRAFGNAVARTGGGKNELDRVTVQLTQLASKGKVLSQDLRPIIEAAPAVGKALRDAFHTIDPEQIQKLGLSSGQFLNRLVTELEKLPPTTGGVRNGLENLSDASFRLKAAIGGSVMPVIAPLISRIADLFENVSRLDPAVLGLGVRLAAAAAIIGPLLLVAGKLVTTVSALAPVFSAVAGVMTGPFGIAAALVIGAAIAIKTNFLGIGDAARDAWARVVEIMQTVLPATLPLVRAWVNFQVGYFVGLARAAGVVFEEIASNYSSMLDRMKPATAPVRSFVQHNLIDSTVRGFEKTFERARGLFGAGDQIAEGFNSATPRAAGAARNFSQRVADAFNSGFGRDFVGEAGDALTAAFARIRAALSARAPISGGTPSFLDNLGSGLTGGANAADKMAGLLDGLSDMLRDLAQLQKFRGVSSISLLPQDAQEQIRVVDALTAEVDKLEDGLRRLQAAGRAAPQGMVQGIALLHSQVTKAVQELDRLAFRFNFAGPAPLPGGRIDAGPLPQHDTVSLASTRDSVKSLDELSRSAKAASDVLKAYVLDLGATIGRGVQQIAAGSSQFLGNVLDVGSKMVKSGASIAEAAPAALAFAAAMEIATGLFNIVGPVINALAMPLRIMGEIVGLLIVPVLRILWQPLKILGIVVSYIGEVIAKVAGAIATAIGSLVRGLGRLINKLPGSPGDPLVRAGQAMINLGSEFKDAAKEMIAKRKELEGLSFEDAVNGVDKAVNKLAEALTNVPPLFNLALRRLQAASGGTSVPGGTGSVAPPTFVPPATPEAPPVPLAPVVLVIDGDGNRRSPDDDHRALIRSLARRLAYASDPVAREMGITLSMAF